MRSRELMRWALPVLLLSTGCQYTYAMATFKYQRSPVHLGPRQHTGPSTTADTAEQPVAAFQEQVDNWLFYTRNAALFSQAQRGMMSVTAERATGHDQKKDCRIERLDIVSWSAWFASKTEISVKGNVFLPRRPEAKR